MSDQPTLWETRDKLLDLTDAELQRKLLVVHDVEGEPPHLVHFDAARPHARRTDPYTSDQALKAIAKDGTLMAYIWHFAKHCATREPGVRSGPFNDTELTEYIEDASGKRAQRNVVARSRGMLEDAGLLRQAGVREYEGRDLMHYEIQPTKEHGNG